MVDEIDINVDNNHYVYSILKRFSIIKKKDKIRKNKCYINLGIERRLWILAGQL